MACKTSTMEQLGWTAWGNAVADMVKKVRKIGRKERIRVSCRDGTLLKWQKSVAVSRLQGGCATALLDIKV